MDALVLSRLNTVMVAPTTSNLKRGRAPGNTTLTRKQSGLHADSVVLCCQVMCLDKAFFTQRIAPLSDAVMTRIDAALRLTLSL